MKRKAAPDSTPAVVLYPLSDGASALQVRLDGETVWLDAHQMARLFGRDRTVVVRHVRNVFQTKELDRRSSCARTAQIAGDGRRRLMDLYNLDVIIAVGYRVNSKRGTQFRIWASRILRDHIVKGYSANERRLDELKQTLRLVSDVATRRTLSGDEGAALLAVVKDYSYALDLLDDYDHQRVTAGDVTSGAVEPVTHDEVGRVVERLRADLGASDLFGREKDGSLGSALGNIMQTWDGQELYPSLEEKAAQLLYSLVKNHPFVDGNKRIAAALFLWFLEKNRALYRKDGGKRIADNALVAMTLLIAESRPAEKNVLTRVLVNLINRRNA